MYLWADGVYFNVRLTDERPCVLVVVGTLEDGRKELIAVHDGERESKLSWVEVLRDLKRRGLLDETLVLWAGEMGRTPHSSGKDGRVHHVSGYTVCLAGGGVKRCPPSAGSGARSSG